ncbi:helix-turn-helix domain-containing protein [Paraburkholderia sp. 1N]|uniref:Helix-turn-helix domain-containing protein n=1 Tax=Paraburkholderia solitsugae TaxID=2675748 RepID=A0ABX2C523_9BURK|nr:helix-turn-helix domain-containing protein [Paraburkholderia solitsugae]
MANRVGVTERHLRRISATEYGLSAVEFILTQRLLLAKRLLTDTALPRATVRKQMADSCLRDSRPGTAGMALLRAYPQHSAFSRS